MSARTADVSPAARFSTAGLSPARRRASWEAWNASALIGVSTHVADPGRFVAAEANLTLPRVRAAHVRASAHRLERGATEIGAAATGSLALYLPVDGVSAFDDGTGSRRIGPGDALLCDADRPFRRTFAADFGEIAIRVPWQVLDAGGEGRPHGADRSARTVDVSGGRYAHLAQRLRGALAVGLRGGDAWPLESAVLDLAAVLLTGRPREVDHHGAALSYIAHRLAASDLSAGRVSAALGISERTLSRVFAARGTTLPAAVVGLRLERARALLASSDVAPAEIARRCGFTSTSYFCRVFKEHFALTPGQARAAAG